MIDEFLRHSVKVNFLNQSLKWKNYVQNVLIGYTDTKSVSIFPKTENANMSLERKRK